MSARRFITLNLVSPEWIAERREVIGREGFALRAAPIAARIEIKTQRPEPAAPPNTWIALTLPGGALEFLRLADRDAVLRQLTGERLNDSNCE